MSAEDSGDLKCVGSADELLELIKNTRIQLFERTAVRADAESMGGAQTLASIPSDHPEDAQGFKLNASSNAEDPECFLVRVKVETGTHEGKLAAELGIAYLWKHPVKIADEAEREFLRDTALIEAMSYLRPLFDQSAKELDIKLESLPTRRSRARFDKVLRFQ